MAKLEIYVGQNCWASEEARRIAAETQALFAGVKVMLIDLQSADRPPGVFASPTYVLKERIISLGNPQREVLWGQLRNIKNGSRPGGDAD